MGFNIAHFGAFNIESYGDSLFAEVLRNEISKRLDIDNIILFSIDGIDVSYNNNGKVYSYSEFDTVNEKIGFDAIVVGGGELLHYKPIEFANKSLNEIYKYPAGKIWKYPIEMGEKYDIPIIFNAVGVPYDIEQCDKLDFLQFLSKIAYLSVRDNYSYERLVDFVECDNLKLVPDSVFMINKYYDKIRLESIFINILKSKNWQIKKQEYMVVQYGTLYEVEELCRQIEKIITNYDIKVVVLPINYCHEDIQASNEMKMFFKNSQKVHFVDFKLSPIDIMAIISNSKIFVGTSLHGNLTAITYEVESIALDMYRDFVSKIDGLYELVNLSKNVLPNPLGLYSKFIEISKNNNVTNKVNLSDLDIAIKKHFDDISKLIRNKTEKKVKIVEESQCDIKNKFVKSFIEFDNGEKIEQLYGIAKLINNKYSFVFEFEKLYIDTKFSFNVSLNGATRIKIFDSYANNNNIYLNAENPINVDEEKNIFVEEIAVFKGDILGWNDRITINCTIQKCDEMETIIALKNSNNNRRAHLDLLLDIERKLKTSLIEKDEELIAKDEELKNLRYKKKAELFDLNQSLINKEAHIELLLESDRELNRIYNSRSWRYMNSVWRLRDMLLPQESKRRLLIKVSVKFIKHPIKFIKKLSPKKIKKFFYYMKKEGVTGVSNRIEDSLIGIELQKMKIDISKIEMKVEKKYEDYDKLLIPNFVSPTISIIIPVYNEFEYTYNCIKSILKHSVDVEYEIIIANDCSTDLTTRIEEIVTGISLINNEENLRFLKNCNNAANHAKGKYILFLNNDTQVQEDWLNPLIRLIESDSQIGMVGSKLVYPDGKLQEAGGIFWSDGSAWNYGNKSNTEEPEYNYVKEVDYISGAAIMLPSRLWKEIGGFDEQFIPAYCEDSDLAFTVRKMGYKVMYQPLSVVVHFEGVSNGTNISSGQKSYQILNQKKLFEKWKNILEKEHFKNAHNVFQARDRSRNKKTILVIDHYVPHYDKDAGSRTVYQYLKLFVDMGFNVKFIGDNFFKHEPYTSQLQQMGIEVLYGTYYANNWKIWIKDNAEYIDYVFLNRPHISVKYIDFIKSHTKAKIIYYGHDLHFLREMREYGLTGDEYLLKTSQEWRDKELELMRKADVSYYPSIIEENEIKSIDNSINVKSIPAYIFDDVNPIQYTINNRNDIMFIGGFKHKPNVDAVIWLAEEIYPVVSAYNLGIKFYILGSNPPDEIKKYANENFIIKGFVEDDELENYYNTCRLSIVPLRYGAGIKGKVVEAMKNGIPVITTSVGAEGIIGSEEFLCIEESAVKFADKIIYLYNEEAKLKDMSEKSKEYVKSIFNVKNVIEVIGEDFNF